MTLQQMRDIDIRTVDPDTVVRADSISVNMDLPARERMIDVANQMGGNPYFMRSGDILVKIGHIDTPITANDRAESWMRTL